MKMSKSKVIKYIDNYLYENILLPKGYQNFKGHSLHFFPSDENGIIDSTWYLTKIELANYIIENGEIEVMAWATPINADEPNFDLSADSQYTFKLDYIK